MTNKIEELQNGVSEVKSQLYELKNNIKLSAKEKKEQADGLKSKAEDLWRQIESELSVLSASTDAEAQQNIEKLLSSQEILREIQDLYASILTSLESSEEEKEWFWEWTKDKYWKAKTRVVEKWNAAADYFKTEQWKSTLRKTWIGAAIVWWGALIIGWIRRLFSGETKEERMQNKKERKEARKQWRKERREARRQARKERKEAKRRARQERRIARSKLSFWERPIWKVIKRTWIWTIAYLIIHRIYTWKLTKDVLDWKSEGSERAREQISEYKELSPEDREKYEHVWEKVNEFYDNVRANEKSYGYESPYDLGTISKNINLADWVDWEAYEGLVPFCMDQSISNIGELLSEKNFTTYIFDKNTTEVIEHIKWWWSDKLEKLLWPYVKNLKSFKVFNARPFNSLWEKIEAWMQDNSQERIDELNFFFRQYTKVLTYMKDKERSIAYKIAEEKCQSELDGKTESEKVNIIQNKLNDDSRFKNNVENDTRYQSFMSSKILNSEKALSDVSLFDWNVSPIVKKWIIDPLDNEFNNIMQVDEYGKTIIDCGIEDLDAGASIWARNKKNLERMCDDLKDDIADSDDWGWLFAWFSYIFNDGESNMKQFLEESWLGDFMDKLNGKIDWIKENIKNWNITKEELKQLQEVALAYFAFQKEMQLAMYTLQSIKSDNPDLARRGIEWFKIWFNNYVDRLNKIFGGDGTFWDYLVVTVATWQITLVLSSSARRAAGKVARKWFKRTIKQPANALVRVAWRPVFSNTWFRKALNWLTDLSQKQSYFLHYALNWKIRDENFLLDVAEKELWMTSKPSKMSDVFSELLKREKLTKEQCDMLWKYAWNSDIKKIILKETSGGVSDIIWSWFKPISRTFTVEKDVISELLKLDKQIEDVATSGYPKASKIIRKMLEESVTTKSEIDDLFHLAIDDDFAQMLEGISDDRKLTKRAVKQFKKVRTSTAWADITTEMKKTGLVHQRLVNIEDFRRELVMMNPEEFDSFKELFDLFKKWWVDAAFDHITIIDKIIKDWIETVDASGTKKIETFDDAHIKTKLLQDPDYIEDLLKKSTPEWKKAAWLWDDAAIITKRIADFKEILTDIKKSKKLLSNVDELAGIVKKAARLLTKLT